MREYDKQEVAFLQKQDTVVTYEGMPVLVKKARQPRPPAGLMSMKEH